jgi:predicted O-methyltransferase YrrM
MDNLQLLVDLHKDATRQGPGSEAETRLAVSLSGIRGKRNLRIADIGCGTGASTLILAKELDAHITAVDLLPEFLKALERAAAETGVKDRITTLAHSMDALPCQG